MMFFLFFLYCVKYASAVFASMSNETNVACFQVEFSLLETYETSFGAGEGAELEFTLNFHTMESQLDGVHEIYVVLATQDQDCTQFVDQTVPMDVKKGSHIWNFVSFSKKYVYQLTSESQSVHAKSTILLKDRYYVQFINPRRLQYSIDGDISIKNTWGHLQLGEEYWPTIFMAKLICASLLFPVWLVWIAINRQYLVIPHHIISVLFILRIFEASVEYSSYEHFNKYGHFDLKRTLLLSFSMDLFEIGGLIWMMVVASGWTIMRSQLSTKEFKTAIGTTLMYSGVCVAERMCYFIPKFCHFVLLLRFILRSFLLVGIIAMINALISRIVDSVTSERWLNGTDVKYKHWMMYKYIRNAFLVMILIPTTIFAIRVSAFSWEDKWTEALMRDIVFLPICEIVMIGWFAPSRFSTNCCDLY